MRRLHSLNLGSDALFRLKVMDIYSRMEKKNVSYLCKLLGISRSFFYKWRARYNPLRLTTLNSQSRRPKSLKSTSWSTVVEVCNFKRQFPVKSHYYLYNLWIKQGRIPLCCAKTIYNWWRKRGLIVTRHKRKRRKTKLFNRASLPGELVQIDTKFLDGRKRFQYTAIDVVTKWRSARIYGKLNQAATCDFLARLAKLAPFKITRIQTDNGLEFQSEVVKYLAKLGITHQYTWIHTPDQNGCVERSHRTDEEEFYQQTETRDLTLDELNCELELWIKYYNEERLHFSLNFDTPREYLEKFEVSTI